MVEVGWRSAQRVRASKRAFVRVSCVEKMEAAALGIDPLDVVGVRVGATVVVDVCLVRGS